MRTPLLLLPHYSCLPSSRNYFVVINIGLNHYMETMTEKELLEISNVLHFCSYLQMCFMLMIK